MTLQPHIQRLRIIRVEVSRFPRFHRQPILPPEVILRRVRKQLPQRPPNQVCRPPPHHLGPLLIHVRVAPLPVQHGQSVSRTLEHVLQPGGHRIAFLLRRQLLRQILGNRHHATNRAPHIAYRTVAVRPVHILQNALPYHWNKAVLEIKSLSALQSRLQRWPDNVPRFAPADVSRLTQ